MRRTDISAISRILAVLLMLLTALSLTSCGDDGEGTPEYNLYYTNSAASRLIAYTYESATSDRLALAGEFFESMQSVTPDLGVSAIPAGVTIERLNFSGDILVLETTGSLDGESAARLLMFYSAATRAVSQLDNITGLQINLNGSSVTDINGVSMGIMRTSRFVNNAVDDPEDYRESEVTFYFGNEAGDRLVKCSGSVAYRSSTPLERVIIERLIAGPAANGVTGDDGRPVTATLPTGLTLLGINIRDGICYVNIDDKLIKEAAVAHDEVAVYSIVNTLMELDGVRSVMLTINGVSDVTMPMGQISFTEPFVYNEMLVE